MIMEVTERRVRYVHLHWVLRLGEGHDLGRAA